MKNILISAALFISASCWAADAPSLFSITEYQKVKGLTDHASQAYKFAQSYGWPALVTEFENGNVKNSVMKKKEISTLCNTAFRMLAVNDVKRLIAAGCIASPDHAYQSINTALKYPNGKVDEQAIIAKLKFYQEQNIFKTQQNYGRGYRAYSVSVLDLAVSHGLADVTAYLFSIGLKPSKDTNLLTSHFNGSLPNLKLTNLLLASGIKPARSTLLVMEKRHFETAYPDIYDRMLQELNHLGQTY